MGWNPEVYERFRRERQQPFYDLLELVSVRRSMHVVDLGCGTGRLTRVLHERLGAQTTLGIDDSPEMLGDAPSGDRAVTFRRQSIEAFAADADGPAFDLVFSNAALHWVADHPSLFEQLAGRLVTDGQLAVQMPDNFGWHSHQAALSAADEPEFREALSNVSRPGVLRAEDYAEILHRLEFRWQCVRLQVYPHVLPSRQHAVEWARGTILTPYRARLDDEAFEAFVARYAALLFERLDAPRDDEPLFFPYRRLLVAARR